MPDWKKLVRERIASSRPSVPTQAEVVSELAAHLEETYAAALSQGSTEKAAVEFALQEVNDWHVLAANIRQAKSEGGIVNDRTRNLWLPGMASLLGASLLLLILQRASYQPRLVWFGHMAMLFYWPWLAGLPAFGALGAYLSKRAHARFVNRLIVGLSPALAVLGAFGFVLPVALLTDRHLLTNFPFAYFALTIVNWVLLPAFALLIGALPFLREPRRPAATEA